MARGIAALLLMAAVVTVVECQFPFGNFFRPRRPSRPVFSRPAPPPARAPQRPRGGCAPSAPNHNFGGKGYVLSWLNGCTSFTGSEAAGYCRSMNMKPISLDDRSKADHFIGVLARAPTTYFWTGGNVDHRGGRVNWANGASQGIRDISYWSHTGGNRRPQPDNREGRETCLGVLNGVYNDGIKFHDISCHHRKPVICEA